MGRICGTSLCGDQRRRAARRKEESGGEKERATAAMAGRAAVPPPSRFFGGGRGIREGSLMGELLSDGGRYFWADQTCPTVT